MSRRSYTSLEDFYQDLKELISVLEAQGLSEVGQTIDNHAFNTAWTTGSELLENLAPILEQAINETSGDLKERLKSQHYFTRNYRRLLKLNY